MAPEGVWLQGISLLPHRAAPGASLWRALALLCPLPQHRVPCLFPPCCATLSFHFTTLALFMSVLARVEVPPTSFLPACMQPPVCPPHWNLLRAALSVQLFSGRGGPGCLRHNLPELLPSAFSCLKATCLPRFKGVWGGRHRIEGCRRNTSPRVFSVGLTCTHLCCTATVG